MTASANLPLTIQAAIAARLDELAPDERQLLQHVSVAGETFDVRDAALLTEREPTEIAGMLGVSAVAARARASRGMARLRAELVRFSSSIP